MLLRQTELTDDQTQKGDSVDLAEDQWDKHFPVDQWVCVPN